jgi:hypothetical protein
MAADVADGAGDHHAVAGDQLQASVHGEGRRSNSLEGKKCLPLDCFVANAQ